MNREERIAESRLVRLAVAAIVKILVYWFWVLDRGCLIIFVT